MNTYAPIARIIIRYGAGFFLGAEVASQLATDPDVVVTVTMIVAAVVGFVTEAVYAIAKKRGWAT